jgi:ribose transport system substrate-binding protein
MGGILESSRRRSAAVLALTVLLALGAATAAGCGDSDSESNDAGPQSGAVAKNVEIAKENIAPYIDSPSPEPKLDQLRELPEGKTVAYLNCGIPQCNVVWEQMQEPAEKIGFDAFQVKAGNDPQTIAGAIDSALQRNPDIIFSGGQPNSLFKPGLAKMTARGIPLIGIAVPDEAGTEAEPVVIYNTSTVTKLGGLMADYTFVESQDDTKAVFFWPQELGLFGFMAEGFETELKARCGGCSLEVVPISITTVGTTLPSRVVSYLQQNPDVNWVAMAFVDLAAGVPQALSAAGISDVKIISQGGDGPILNDIRAGRIEASLLVDSVYQGYQEIDAAARVLAGQELPENYKEGIPQPAKFFTTDNTTEEDVERGGLVSYPDTYRQTFERAWGLSE